MSTAAMVAGIAVAAVIAAIVIAPFAFRYFNSGASNDSPIEIEDQPVILNGSGWDAGLAELAINKAADMWNRLAKVVVKPRPAINLDQECDAPGCLRNYLNGYRPDINRLKAILAGKGVTTKHVTFFIASADTNVPGVTDTLNFPHPVYISADAINDGATTGGSLTIAHEWGHSFGLSHKIYPNLMIFGPLAGYGLQESLTTQQRATARQGAETFR